jgi:hypothetical protein
MVPRWKPPAYKVGYQRPPKATQFTRGKSGNPKGRPKGSRSVGAILSDIIQQKIAVTEKGKTRHLSVIEVTLRQLAAAAMKGDTKALNLLLSLVERHRDSPETVLEVEALLAEDRAILAHFLPDAARPGG